MLTMSKKSYFHATWADLGNQIMIQGLKPGWEGIVYLTDSMDDVLKLMGFRLFSRIEGVEKIEHEGKEHDVPTIKEFDHFLVFEVELDENDVTEQFDHSAAFFGGARAWGYEGTISPSRFINLYEIGEKAEAE